MVGPATSGPAAGEPKPAARPALPWAGVIPLLTLTWLAVAAAEARVELEGNVERTLMLLRPLLEFPQVMTASLATAAAVALAVLEFLSRRADRDAAVVRRTRARFGIAAAAGIVPGLGVAVPLLLGYPDFPYVPVFAGLLVGAGLLGGLLAALPARAAVAAGVFGAFNAFVVVSLIGESAGDLLPLFGAGDTMQSWRVASDRLELASGLAAGLVAGICAYWYLRWADRGARWPAYLGAGALPGVLTLVGEAATRACAPPLVRLIDQMSAVDLTFWDYLPVVRLNHALVMLFAGALVTILLLGHFGLRSGSGSARGSAEETVANGATAGGTADGTSLDDAAADATPDGTTAGATSGAGTAEAGTVAGPAGERRAAGEPGPAQDSS